MLCKCTNLIKKRTLLDGIKNLSGELHVYVLEDEKYLRECCFKMLIPSLYNFINKGWFLDSQMIICEDNNSTYMICKISDSIFTELLEYATPELTVVEHTSDIKLLNNEYNKIKYELTALYQSIIKLEKELKDMSYKYSSISFDNENLNTQIDSFRSKENTTKENQTIDSEENELMNKHSRIDHLKIPNKQCIQCKSFSAIKDDLKQLKQENYEKIALAQYEHEIAKRKIIELKHNTDVLQEENIRLKEENKLLRTTSTIYSNISDSE